MIRHEFSAFARFLTACGVVNDNGLTDADFMKDTPTEKLIEAATRLFENFDHAEVAAYLLFLDASNQSQTFAPFDLEKRFGA